MMMIKQISLVSALIMVAVTAWPWSPKVSTEYGEVMGKEKDGINVFHSIPFAAPPVGDLRFASPVPPQKWSNTLDTTGLPHICPQMQPVDGVYLGKEDCLYLHVYAPKRKASDPLLPVAFWIFGGAYIIGDGYEFGWYDGKHLASNHDVIIVTPNYRVGAFGFLAHQHLQDETATGSTGNFGIQDQRMAMEWVQRNIQNFGGDPKRVTIWGESAGGFSVCHHLSNGQKPDLFSAAIMDSGNCDTPEVFQPLDKAMEFGNLYSEAVGCVNTTAADYLSCMRAAPVSKVLDTMASWFTDQWPYHIGALNDTLNDAGFPSELLSRAASLPVLAPLMPWGPAIDGSADGLPENPLEAMKGGRHNKVPFMLGSNHDEGNLFVPVMPLIVPGVKMPFTEDGVSAVMHHVFDNDTSTDIQPLWDAYPVEDFDSVTQLGSVFIRDYLFLCPSRRAARAVVAAGQPAFLYQFSYHNEWIDSVVMKTYHTSELEYVWGNAWPPVIHAFFTASDRKMRDDMGQYWMNFVKYHDPSGSGDDTASFPWPAFDAENEQSIQLNVPSTVDTFLNQKYCDPLDEYLGRA